MINNFIGLVGRRPFLRYMAVFFFGLLVLSGPAGAVEQDIIHARPALWKVEKGDGTTYLLGSFHLLPNNYRWFEGILKKSYDSSSELVMETVMDDKAMAQIQMMMIQNSSFDDGDSLKNYLDQAHYQKMLSLSKSLMGLDEMAANRIKPWFMAINLSIMTMMSKGMDPNSGVDSLLQKDALTSGKIKILSGLETPNEQMSALIHHPLDVQAAMLTDTLDKMDDFDTYIKSYLAAWASGNSDDIAKAMLEDMEKYRPMYEALLVNRNKNWLPKIEQHINSGRNIFIVVGAAHLVGKDGVVKLLRDKGYQLQKIQ